MTTADERLNEEFMKNRRRYKKEETEANGAAPPQVRILTAEEFVKGYVAPDYLIEGIIQRSRFYSCTAPTGHGKTAVSLALAVHMALGRPVCGRDVAASKGVYLAAENPDDTIGRFILTADRMALDLKALPLRFIAGAFSLQDSLPSVRDQVERIGGADFVIIDTGPRFQLTSGFADENDNMQALSFAGLLRSLTDLPGKPAVIANTHPTKHADKQNLIPRGGSAFLNEVDGNLTLWAPDDRKVTSLHWGGKFRGAAFDPVMFALEPGTCRSLVDKAGRLIPSVWAIPTTEETAEKAQADARDDENSLMVAMLSQPFGSLATWASMLDWKVKSGAPNKMRVSRCLDRLKRDGLVKEVRSGKFILTARGKAEAEQEENGVRGGQK